MEMGNKLQQRTTKCLNKVLGHDKLSGQHPGIDFARTETWCLQRSYYKICIIFIHQTIQCALVSCGQGHCHSGNNHFHQDRNNYHRIKVISWNNQICSESALRGDTYSNHGSNATAKESHYCLFFFFTRLSDQL